MAAAVADFRPRDPADHKLKKTDPSHPPRLELEPTEDVLSGLSARRRPGQVLVGFAAEHGDGAIDYGRGKLERKGLDAIVVNDISRPGHRIRRRRQRGHDPDRGRIRAPAS